MNGPTHGRPGPVDRLRRRNQRAVRFLSSISTSGAAPEDAGWTGHDGTPGDGGGPPGSCRQGGADPCKAEAAVGRHVGALVQQATGRSSLVEDGRSGAGLLLHGRSHSDTNRVPLPAASRPEDAHGGEPDGELGPPRPTAAFPAVFSSIKPFVGKADDRSHHHGAGNSSDQPPPVSALRKDESFAHLLRPLHTLTPEAERDAPAADGGASRAGAVDDTEQQSGLHRAVAGLTEYVGTILDNVRADDQRQDGSDRVRDAHADAVAARPTAEQMRRLRALMLRVAREQDLELSTAAIGWVYFEKLCAKSYVVKGNRKLVAATCLLLALKINDGRGDLVSRSLQAIQRRFEVSDDSILDQEFSVFAELDFSLWVPRREFMPHFLRMFEAAGLNRSLGEYLGGGEFFEHPR